jgi:hypothetical protein
MKRVLFIDRCLDCKYFSNISIRNNKTFDKYYCFLNPDKPLLVFKIEVVNRNNDNEFKIPDDKCKLIKYGKIISALRIANLKSHTKKRSKERLKVSLEEIDFKNIIGIINKDPKYQKEGESRALTIYELNTIKIEQTLMQRAHIVYYKKINKTFLLIYNKKYKEITTILKELNSIDDIISSNFTFKKDYKRNNFGLNLFCPNKILNENIYKYPYDIFRRSKTI